MTQSSKGYVLWITGLSGAGKTTVATGVVDALKKINIPTVMLDGDNLRSILSSKWGYTTEERHDLAFVYSRLCKHLSDSGVNVVCATVAMFDDVRKWNRENMTNYLEVYLKVPLEVLVKRDTKGLYKKFANDTSSESVFSANFELPTFPDIVIENYDRCTPEDAEWKIVNTFLQKLVYGAPILQNEKQRHDLKAGTVEYWDKVYSKKSVPEYSSPFSVFCLEEKFILPNNEIVEFGCGNGRDAFFFAKTNRVTAIDPSSVAIERNTERAHASPVKKNLNFFVGRFGEAELPVENVDIVYSRFVMHAMNQESENLALQEAYRILKPGGLLLLEFRTVKDDMAKKGFSVGVNEKITDHYRRFIDAKQFVQNLIQRDFEIAYFVESNGLAVYGDEDPVVARIAARKI